MDLSSSTENTNSPLTPVFGDNVPDILGPSLQHIPSAIITVNSTADAVDDFNSGVTTLRDAIKQANADTGLDLIVFDRSLFSSQQTITLSLGELDITKSLDIIAPRDPLTGGDLVTVSANKASRVFEIESGATVTLSGLIETDGLIKDNGGGILNSGTLTLDSNIVSNNSISDLFFNVYTGGGIYNTGTLEVSNSTISGNVAANGGGIYNLGTLTVSNSTLSNNSARIRINADGGGIYNMGKALVINSTLSNNIAGANAGGGGGGIFNAGILQLSNSNLNNNLATANGGSFGGGIDNTRTGTLKVNNSTITDNSVVDNGSGISGGGGIFNNGTTTVSNSTISNNFAPTGGGIYNDGSIDKGMITVSNSTIIGNSAIGNGMYTGRTSKDGGGIYNDGTLTLVFSTLTLNSAANGSGVYNSPGSTMVYPLFPQGTAYVRNTIIASNLPTADGVNPDVSGSFISNGYNLIGDDTGSTGFGSPGDILGTGFNPIDPRLAPLDFYGGPTKTITLLPNSPAVDAADPTVLDTDPTTDQRGFPRVNNGYADIGATENSFM